VAVAVEQAPYIVLDEDYRIVEVGPAAWAAFGPLLQEPNVRTLATLTASLRRIEAELAGRAPEQLDPPAPASPQAPP